MNVSDAAWVAGRYAGSLAAIHAFVRVLTCPFDTVIAELPDAGSVLDVGCGHGVLGVLARRDRPRLSIAGIDLDKSKVAAARRAGEDATCVDEAGLVAAIRGNSRWAAITIVDVLYVVSRDRADGLLTAAAGALHPGGVLVVKETGSAPRWKSTLSALQERVATSRIGPTEATCPPRPYPLERGATLLAERGLRCQLRSVDRGYHVPHRLLVARRLST